MGVTKLTIGKLPLLLMTGLFFSTCQSRRLSHFQAVDQSNHAAWFTKSTMLGRQSIKACILNDRSGFSDSYALGEAVKETFYQWIGYIDDKNVEDGNANDAFIRDLVLQDDCETADLKIVFGPHDTEALGPIVPELSYASVFPKQRIMWITEHGENLLARSDGHWRRLNYRDPYMLRLVLMHEWGHIFGNRHVPGTIMDESVLDFQIHALAESSFLNTDQRKFIFDRTRGKIDFTRELYFSDPLKFNEKIISTPDFQSQYDIRMRHIGIDDSAVLSSRSLKFNHILYDVKATKLHRRPLPQWPDAEVFIRKNTVKKLYHQTAEITAKVYGIHAETRISRNAGSINMPRFFISYRCPAYTRHDAACDLIAGEWADQCKRALNYQIFYYTDVADVLKTEGIFNKDDLANYILKTMIIEPTCGEMIESSGGDRLRYPQSVKLRNQLAKIHRYSSFNIHKYSGPRSMKPDTDDDRRSQGRYIKLKHVSNSPFQIDLNRFRELCWFNKKSNAEAAKSICTYQSKKTDLMYLHIEDFDGKKNYLALRKISRNINDSIPAHFTSYEADVDFKMCRRGYAGCHDMSRFILKFGRFPDAYPGESPKSYRHIMLLGQRKVGSQAYHIGTPYDLCPRDKAEMGCYSKESLGPQ